MTTTSDKNDILLKDVPYKVRKALDLSKSTCTLLKLVAVQSFNASVARQPLVHRGRVGRSERSKHLLRLRYCSTLHRRNPVVTNFDEDPEDNAKLCDVADLGREDARKALEAAQKAFVSYKTWTNRERRGLIRRWADQIKENKEDLAAICTMELGKPFTESLGTVKYGTDFLDWFEGDIERQYGETIPAAKGNNRIFTIRQPQGVVAAITPWNSPVAMVTRKVGAAIAAGNTVVLKPAPETPLCAIALAKLFDRSGGPPGVLNIVTSSVEKSPEIGEEFTQNEIVKHLSFTGSTAVGRHLHAEAARRFIKTSMELGGNAPFIVFGDAKLDSAAEGVIASKFRSSGQTCVCANRIFVHRSIADEFAKVLEEKMNSTFTFGSVWDKDVRCCSVSSTIYLMLCSRCCGLRGLANDRCI